LKQIIIDIVGLIGFGALMYALYCTEPVLAYGIGGIMLMLFSFFASKNSAVPE